MDMRIRKLFLPQPNQTVACPDFCDPECPVNCYHPFPDISFSPPPLPPPYSDQNHHIPTSVIIVVSLLSIFFLAVGYYVVKGKSCPGWCCKSNGQQPSSQSDGSDEEFIDGNQVDHHIWFISTVGLQPSVISSITICKYKKGEGLIEGTECSVCLSEFQENETLRLLPKCSHAFHISCIDYWLRSHTNCPLCRAHIVSGTVGADDSGANEDAQMENSDNQVGNSGICENRSGTEDLNAETRAARRAVSVDSCADLSIGICVDDQTGEFENSDSDIVEKQEGGLMGSSSIGQCLHKSPASMRRSFSCDGRFSSSRQNRSLNSTLPL